MPKGFPRPSHIARINIKYTFFTVYSNVILYFVIFSPNQNIHINSEKKSISKKSLVSLVLSGVSAVTTPWDMVDKQYVFHVQVQYWFLNTFKNVLV